MFRTIWEGLTLPLRIWFQPLKFLAWAYSFAPDLPPSFTLLAAYHRFNETAIRRGISRLLLCFLIAYLWVPIIALLAYWIVPHAAWAQVQLGLIIALLLGLLLSLVGSLRSNFIFLMIVGIAFGGVFGTAASVSGAILSSMSYTTGLSVGQIVDQAPGNNAAILGAAVGVVFGMLWGILSRRGVVVYGTLSGAVIALAFYFFSSPHVQSANTISALCFMVTISHQFLYPFEWLNALIILLRVRSDPTTARDLWKFSPAYWDEFVLLPLPGTVDLLVALYQQDAAQGTAAIQWIALNPFQRRAALKAAARLQITLQQ